MDNERIPYVAFGNEELARQPKIQPGDFVLCPRCGQQHEVVGADSTTGDKNLLLFYQCGEDSFLAGVSGASVMGIDRGGGVK